MLITLAHVEQAIAHAAVRYDRTGDQHYDVASALIKSMRGSDVDAALHYLARMLEAGEDPRFIARRVVIAASEDVGMADPTALRPQWRHARRCPDRAARGAHHPGAGGGPQRAGSEVERRVQRDQRGDRGRARGPGRCRPPHLRGTGYAGRERLGHGAGYVYAHDEPDAVARQQYLR